MAITDLTGTKWKINATVSDVPNPYYIGVNAKLQTIYDTSLGLDGDVVLKNENGAPAFTKPINNAYLKYWGVGKWRYSSGGIEPYEEVVDDTPFVEITGGTDVRNSELIAWFEANATLLYQPPEKLLGEEGLRQCLTDVKEYIDGKTGDLSNLATTEKTNLVSAINEVYEKSGEPFRVKEWNVTNLTTVIPTCTTDIANTSIDKFLYKITGQEATDYQIVGMIAYQVTDSSGSRINCWPVCQFTGQGQTELNVRFMCGGTTNKTAARLQGWVLLKHR